MHPHDDVVLGGVGVGHFRQGEPLKTRSPVMNRDRSHLRHPVKRDVRTTSQKFGRPAPGIASSSTSLCHVA